MLSKVEIDFEKIRMWAVIVIVQAASFGMGMYTARTYWRDAHEPSASLNYSTEQPKSQNQTAVPAAGGVSQAGGAATASLDPQNCSQIKGNISGSNKTYHMPGGAFYDRTTTPEMCFSTESEAQAAGFKKSSR
ncbi:hypothetical protein IPM19_02720 [bacterium]|nr:MAG: hypothetical protein IPM19_02720 [bacterium]